MPNAAQIEALRWVLEVRWRLLETYALGRQEGLIEPIGLVIDASHPYAKEIAQHVFVTPSWESAVSRTVTCMERAVLGGILAPCAPDLATALRAATDEPGRWTAVILAERGWVLTGTWQELMTAEASPKQHKNRSRAR